MFEQARGRMEVGKCALLPLYTVASLLGETVFGVLPEKEDWGLGVYKFESVFQSL